MLGFFAVVGIIFIAFMLFCIYFIFKQIQFVLVSVNLYKKMVNRQDAMVKILLDIRDNTKKFGAAASSSSIVEKEQIEDYKPSQETEPDEEAPGFCYYCGAENPKKSKICPKCGKFL